MSAVRMCDRCGVIYSERAEGATTGVAVQNVREPFTNRLRQVEVTIDACPTCSGGSSLQPHLPMIESTASEDQPEPHKS